MFSNIGSKIQGLAKFTAWLGIILSIIFGLIFMSLGSATEIGGFASVMGFLIIILGSLSSWISSWVLYGFGELIVSVTEVSTLNRELITLKHRELSSSSISHQ